MTGTSSAGNDAPGGSGVLRLNPRQIAVKLLPIENGQTVSVLKATDEQFETFRLTVGIPVNEGEEGKKWSFENRCRAINHALKYGLKLPFSNKNNSDSELFGVHESASEVGGTTS